MFKRSAKRNAVEYSAGDTMSEELIESVSVFGGTKRSIISKNFKGGEITSILGGSEINLSQADIQGKAFLEINQLFGGTKLIIPSNWQVQAESTAILGSVEDTRIGNNSNVDPNKTLVIEGTSVFGGISIKSY
jgi:predicted membrane protein